MCSLQNFKYNVNDWNTQSFQYGSDQNGNVTSLVNIASYNLYNGLGVKVGYVQFIDNGIATESTNNFQNSEQLYKYSDFGFIVLCQAKTLKEYI
jgi:hypothetical protein